MIWTKEINKAFRQKWSLGFPGVNSGCEYNTFFVKLITLFFNLTSIILLLLFIIFLNLTKNTISGHEVILDLWFFFNQNDWFFFFFHFFGFNRVYILIVYVLKLLEFIFLFGLLNKIIYLLSNCYAINRILAKWVTKIVHSHFILKLIG